MYALDFNSDSVIPAQLVFNGRIMRRLTPLQPSIIDITSRFAPERLRVEGFIKDIYRRSYGADISVTYPMLMSVRDADGHILAAAGFRVAEQEPLFLEQYIQSPIEQVLAGIYNRNVARSDIAEIGNLASAGKGASIFLFAAIASYLLHLNISYATVTGTDQLHRRLEMTGLHPHVICNADRARLNSEQKSWGTYYDTQPRVLTGSLEISMEQLNRKLGARYQENGITLFPRLHKRGRGIFLCN